MSRGADGKFVKKVERIVDNAENDQVAMTRDFPAGKSPDEIQKMVADGHAQAEQFPTSKLTASEDVDRINLLKLQLQDQKTPGITRFGRLEATEDNFKWLLRKKDKAKEVAFQQWFANKFDRLGPAAKELAREMYPEFYADRVATLEENLRTVEQIAKLKLLGPRTQEDVALQFALDQGFLDTTYLMNLINPGAVNDPNRQTKVQYGLLNPNRYLFHADGLTGKTDYARTHDPAAKPPDAETKLSFWGWVTGAAPQNLDNANVLKAMGLGAGAGSSGKGGVF